MAQVKRNTKPAIDKAAAQATVAVAASPITINGVELAQKVADKFNELKTTSKSAQIRYLDSQRLSRGDIARVMNVKYQHVRNVLITPVKTPKPATKTVSEHIADNEQLLNSASGSASTK